MSARGRRAWFLLRRVLAHPGALLSVIFLAVLILVALLAPLLPALDPLSQDFASTLDGPSGAHWFGTDELGRDILARVIYGARTSLTTAAGSQTAALVAIGITGIPGFARITRAQVMSLRRRDFVTAVEALGGSPGYNMLFTVLPNAWSPILVQVVVLASVSILLEAALAFLGIGIPPPTPSWGEMLRTGKSYLYDSPTYAILPGIALTLTILSLDALGRTLADVLDAPQEMAAARGEA
jgi:ABC-type dipeptide/oligopeptide/nickel transport system permease subunit